MAKRSRSETDPLSRLAEAHGVQLSYTGADGTHHRSGPDTVMAALAALGVPLDRASDAAEVLASERRAPVQPLEPVIAQWSGSLAPVAARLPRRLDPNRAWLTLSLEDGREHRQTLASSAVEPPVVEDQVDRYRLQLAPPAERLPPGYHRLRLEAPGVDASALVIIAPRCPTPPRGWGAFAPLPALRSEGGWGIGSYPDLAELAGWIDARGGELVGTLPLFPLFLDTPPVDPSPYLPVTRLGWNEIHVDPTGLPEFSRTPAAVERLASPEVQARLLRARASALVDHAEVMALIRSILEPMARTLFGGASSRRAELESYLDHRPHLGAYARFRANASGLAEGDAGFVEVVQYHLYAQWAAETQLAAAATPGAGSDPMLYLDLPIGVHPDGFDPQWEPEAFVKGIHGGAPPDAFQRGGQDWAFPPLDPGGLRAQEYRYFITSLRHAMAHARAVRIDHVMGLHRLYWIPEGADATDGVYVGYPAAEMRAIVALEASRSDTVVVGEDLGTVPDQVRSAMDHDGMLRSWVFQFATRVEDPVPVPPPNCVASWGTHDLPTFAGYWEGLDIEEREQGGELGRRAAESARKERRLWRRALRQKLSVPEADPRAVLLGCLDHLATSPAELVLVDLEDLWLEREPQNRPGTGAGARNWRRRAALTNREIFADPGVDQALAEVDSRRRPDDGRKAPGAAEARRRTG
ncbi:MAG TPA: 4-alpha-glucanotransferase [Acidimicrobiales bacterium]|nr:4-alpha-glucanotransferase [Acidimicrobiales bacterium]